MLVSALRAIRKTKKAFKKLTPLEKKVLEYIYHNQPCTEEDIRKHFCGDKGKE